MTNMKTLHSTPAWGRPWSSLAARCAGPEGVVGMESAMDQVARVFADLVAKELGYQVEWDWKRSRVTGPHHLIGEDEAGGRYPEWISQMKSLSPLRERAYREYAPPGDASRLVASFML